MMGTTHAVAGIALAAAAVVGTPLGGQLAVVAALSAALGGLFPDFDTVVGEHRRTLHFPIYYWLLAVPAVVAAALVPDPIPIAVAFFLCSAAVHASSDVLDGTPGMRPWAEDTDNAVYAHATGRWLRARRTIRYDGAPEDFFATAALAVPCVLVFDGVVQSLTVALVGIGGVYTLFRRQIPDVVDRIIN